MYESGFHLRKNSFQLSADPEFLYLTLQHREALTGLMYTLLSRKGMVTLTGEAGTGKTTLVAEALRRIPVERLHSSVILNPGLTPAEFLELALLDFGLPSIPESKAQRVWLLQEMLLNTHAKGKIAALVVDEAHKLSPEVLEEIRLLGNFEFSDQKLLQILLVGQPELAELLNRNDLRQFKQRVAIRLRVEPLSLADVSPYLEHRWKQAGGGKLPFDAKAMEAIVRFSGGIPRLINSLCDNALMSAFGEAAETVGAEHVEMAARDLELVTSRSRKTAPAGAPLQEDGGPEFPKLTLSFSGIDSVRPTIFGRWAGRLGISHQNGRS